MNRTAESLAAAVCSLIPAGIMFGAFVLWAMNKRKTVDPGPSRPVYGICAYHQQIVLSTNPESVRGAAVHAFQAADARAMVTWVGAQQVIGSLSMSMASWGEIVTVWFWPEIGGTGVLIESRPLIRWTLFDWGKNRRNATAIAAYLWTAATGAPIVVAD